MKLIAETVENVQYLTEKREDGKKDFYIKGIFMQAEQTNRNKRIYSESVLTREVNRYNKELVEKNRAFGELGHPNGPSINLDRVSHIITELTYDKPSHNFIGKAKILDTPMGNIARGIIESGGQLGVSSRGMGSLKERNGIMEVQDDYFLATAADIVADPSAPDAFVHGIMEGVEWIWDNGILKAQTLENTRTEINRSAASRNLTEQKKLEIFEKLLHSL